MRESLSYNMIPLPCDMINVGSRNFLTNVSSNAYYGYQPQLHVQNKEANHNESQEMKDNTTKMEVQYNPFEDNRFDDQQKDVRWHANRKRRCCYDEVVEFKKRRQNGQYAADTDDSTNLTSDEQMQATAHQKVHLRKPTHNVPDLPRCMMEYKAPRREEDKDGKEMEDMLREIHGVNMYHWVRSGD